jgi:DNA-binding NarL/FixJ family response regulator
MELSHSARQPVHVVIADDQPRALRALKALLATYEDVLVVGEAANGEESVRLTDACRPDVVVLDVVMPVMDGLEATRSIKRAHPDVAVVAVSMHGATGSPATVAGADAFLLKGFSGDDLARTIHQCAGAWRMPSGPAAEARDGQ